MSEEKNEDQRATVARCEERVVSETLHDCCSQCSDEIPDPSERWPDGDGGTLCQMCWEGHCSEKWWKMLEAYDAEL